MRNRVFDSKVENVIMESAPNSCYNSKQDITCFKKTIIMNMFAAKQNTWSLTGDRPAHAVSLQRESLSPPETMQVSNQAAAAAFTYAYNINLIKSCTLHRRYGNPIMLYMDIQLVKPRYFITWS